MGLEEKRNNKDDNSLDSKSNGRPISFSTGDGNDFSIDLPTSLPGEETMTTNDMGSEDLEKIANDLDAKTKEMEDVLRDMGIDDIDQFIRDNQ